MMMVFLMAYSFDDGVHWKGKLQNFPFFFHQSFFYLSKLLTHSHIFSDDEETLPISIIHSNNGSFLHFL